MSFVFLGENISFELIKITYAFWFDNMILYRTNKWNLSFPLKFTQIVFIFNDT